MKKCFLLLTVLSLMMALPQAMAQSSSLYVHKQDLAEDFILGMDVSSVIALENSGVTFRDFDGKARDLFSILKDNGINYIRVRVWNDPFDEAGRGYGGGNNDLNTAISIGQSAAENGMKLLVDFHYSDFWADPGKQQAPKAWAGMDIKEKQAALYDFTLDALTQLQAAGEDIGMVQLGNETNGRMAGERTWMNIYYLMAAGAKATREVDPNIKIAVHFANPESAGSYMNYASKLDYYKLDYDIFASSYYPFWHGTLDNLTAVLNEVQTTYHKQVLVMETSYANTLEDTDHHPNAIGEGSNYETPYPISIQGQANAVADVIRAVNSIGGLGVFYWEGAWITVGGTYEENQRKWEEHGAGWASSYAAAYAPKAQPMIHSDRGFQYTSYGFSRMLALQGMTQSMSRVGRCLDNAPMEGFWGKVKSEKYYLKKGYSTYEELVHDIETYLEFYNNARLQRKLNNLAPMEYRALAS